MSSKNSQSNQAILAAFALSVTITLMVIYFWFDPLPDSQPWKGFIQGILGNVIATTLSFFAIYLFIAWTKMSLIDDNATSEILSEINQIKDAVTLPDGEISERHRKNWLWQWLAQIHHIQNAELKKHLQILEAIRDESKDSDKIQERIQINAELGSLKEKLRNSEQELNRKKKELLKAYKEMSEKEQEIVWKDRDREGLSKRVDDLIAQMNRMETSLSKALIDMENKLKENQEEAFARLRNNVNNKLKNTQHSLVSEFNKSIPTLLVSLNTNYDSAQPLLPDQATISSVSKSLVSKVSAQTQDIFGDVDIAENKLKGSVEEYTRTVRQSLDYVKELDGSS